MGTPGSGTVRAGPNKTLKLTGAAISVSREITLLQAAPAAYPYRSAIIYAVLGVIIMVVISLITLLLVGGIESLVVFWYDAGGGVLLALGVIGVIFPIVAAIKANHGEVWKYPLSITFLK